jgi:site-specific recombinase XerC
MTPRSRHFRELRGRTQGPGAVTVAGFGGHGIAKGEALQSPRTWFDAACRKAGVYDFTWHCLRHTYASRLVMAGVGVRGVQELMGHKTIAMTCRYTQLAPSHQMAVVRRLDRWAQEGRKNQNATGTKTGTGHFRDQETGEGDSAQAAVQ